MPTQMLPSTICALSSTGFVKRFNPHNINIASQISILWHCWHDKKVSAGAATAAADPGCGAKNGSRVVSPPPPNGRMAIIEMLQPMGGCPPC